MPTLPYGHQSIDEADIEAVVDVLRSEWLTQGPHVEAFEEAIAAYCGTRYAVVASSGTAALHLAYLAAGLGRGDAVLTTPNTFVATANAALYVGAAPVFVDVEPEFANIDPIHIERVLSDNASRPSQVKAIVPVHFAGHPCEMEAITRIAKRHNLLVIEDACHAMGARYAEKPIGSLSDMTVFSFHPVKPMTTAEGGAVVTNHKAFYDRMKRLRAHGVSREEFIQEPDGDWYYEMQLLGYNYRMTDLQAALGFSQLKKLDRLVEKRREIAEVYRKAFAGNPSFDIPSERSDAYSSYHLYPIRLKEPVRGIKDKIFRRLRECGLGVQVHYMPVYWHPFYQRLGYSKGGCPVAEDIYRREISIPLYAAMKDEDVARVIETVTQVFSARW